MFYLYSCYAKRMHSGNNQIFEMRPDFFWYNNTHWQSGPEAIHYETGEDDIL